MSDLMNTINKNNIRAQMNLVYAMLRFLATILDLALDNQMACDTVSSTAEGILGQAAILFRDVSAYTTALSDDGGRISISNNRNNRAGDDHEDLQH